VGAFRKSPIGCKELRTGNTTFLLIFLLLESLLPVWGKIEHGDWWKWTIFGANPRPPRRQLPFSLGKIAGTNPPLRE
jgi:hypothetical protein